MKHNLKITLLLVTLFIVAHIVGLIIIEGYLINDLPLGIEKPQFEEQTSYVPIFGAILLATIIALVLIKFRTIKIWKMWFFLSVFLCLTIAFGRFAPENFSVALAAVLGYFKVYKPNFYLHNFTELFIYGGLAAIFVPVLSISSISILLILISIYDMYSVWKSKHMISLAKFQTKSNVFAGLLIPYKIPKLIPKKTKVKAVKIQSAILGGGDIGFTLIFSGVILKTFGWYSAIIVSLVTATVLLGLFIYGNKNKFYPAMPFLTIGCFIGYLIVILI